MISTAMAAMAASWKLAPVSHPEDERRRRRRMHDRRIKPAGAFGEPQIAGFRCRRALDHVLDVVEQRAAAGGIHFEGEKSVEIDAAGIDHGAWRDALMRGFAGDEACIDFGAPGNHQPVDRQLLARFDDHMIAGSERVHRHDFGRVIGANAGRDQARAARQDWLRRRGFYGASPDRR